MPAEFVHLSFFASADAQRTPEIVYVQGDISDKEAVMNAVKGAECVWHIAAAVGPYHPRELYHKVNVEGTLHVIEACRLYGCEKLVYSSSPSTRFDGSDVDGASEEQLPSLPQSHYLQEYAKTIGKDHWVPADMPENSCFHHES